MPEIWFCKSVPKRKIDTIGKSKVYFSQLRYLVDVRYPDARIKQSATLSLHSRLTEYYSSRLFKNGLFCHNFDGIRIIR